MNLDCVLLVNLWSHFIADVLIQMLNFLEHTSLQLCPSALPLGKFIVTVMIDAEFTVFRPQFLNNTKLLFKNFLQVVDFSE